MERNNSREQGCWLRLRAGMFDASALVYARTCIGHIHDATDAALTRAA
jgi:hypothetical protein